METLYDNKKNCLGCGACAAACPAGAISMEPDPEGFLYPCVEAVCCTGCGRCDIPLLLKKYGAGQQRGRT